MNPRRSIKTSHFALMLAVMVAVFLPLSYFVLGYQKMAIILETEAEANALFASQIIKANPDFWLFENVRLQEFLTHHLVSTARESRRIINLKGNTIAWNQIEIGYPFIIRSRDLHESGNIVGMLEISRSLRPLLWETILVAVLGCLLIAAIYFPLKKYVIDARGEAEKALRESEERYRLLVGNIPAIVFKGYADWEVDIFDDKIEEFLGYKKEEFVSRRIKWKDVVAEEDLQDIKQIFIQAVKTTRSYVREYRVKTKEGKLIWVQERSRIICLDDGRIDHVSGVFFDITERIKAKKASEEQFLFLETLIDNIPSPIFYKNVDGVYSGCNQALSQFLGLPKAEIIGKTVYDIYPRDQADKYFEMDSALFRQPGVQVYDTFMLHADGTSHDVNMRKATYYNADGTLAGLVGVMLDITQRKLVEEALREIQGQQKAILDSIPDIAWLKDKEGRFIAANEPFVQSCGVRQEDLEGKTDLDLWPRELAEKYRRDDLEVMLTAKPKVLEEPIVDKDGRMSHVETIKTPIFNDRGEVTGTSGIARDITVRKQAEDELRRAHKEIEHLFESIPFMMIGLTPDARISHWNLEATKALWVKGMPVAGSKLQDYSLSWEWDKVLQGIAKCREKGAPVRIEDIRYQRPDGKDGLLGITSCPITEEDGRITGLILLGRDVTEQRLLEAQLAQAQKLESIGQLAAGIAHEINTPIQYIGDNTRFLQDAFEDLLALMAEYGKLLAKVREGEETQGVIKELARVEDLADPEYLAKEIPKAIEQSLEGLAHVATIVRAMKEFSHPGTGEKTAVDINKAIESTITVARNEWKYVAEMVTELDPGLPLVPCLADEFNQVILNLIINAAHAIGESAGKGEQAKGTITISTRQDGDWVEVRLQDTGAGIPEEIRSKIFDPFFTTKEVGRGTGQGLAISHSVIVDKHEGTITFETEVNKGTTFIIRLPLGNLGI